MYYTKKKLNNDNNNKCNNRITTFDKWTFAFRLLHGTEAIQHGMATDQSSSAHGRSLVPSV